MDSNNFTHNVLDVARFVVWLLVWLLVGVGVSAILDGLFLSLMVVAVLVPAAYALEWSCFKRRGE